MSIVGHGLRSMLSVAEVIGALGVAFLFAYRFTGKSWYAHFGQAFLILSFSLIAFMLLELGNFWVGGAFAVATAIPLYSLVKKALRKLTEKKN